MIKCDICKLVRWTFPLLAYFVSSCSSNGQPVSNANEYDFSNFYSSKNCQNLTATHHAVSFDPAILKSFILGLENKTLQKIDSDGRKVQLNPNALSVYMNEANDLYTIKLIQSDSLGTDIYISLDRTGNFIDHYYC